MFPLMTAYYASLPVLIHPLFNLAPSFTTDEIIIVIAAVIAVGGTSCGSASSAGSPSGRWCWNCPSSPSSAC